MFSHLPPKTVNQLQVSPKLWKDITEIIRKNVGRIQDRVREIADCVKGLSTHLHFAPCSLSDIVKDVIKTLRLLAGEKDLTLIK